MMRALMVMFALALSASAIGGEKTTSVVRDLDRLQGKWSAETGPRRGVHVQMTIRGTAVNVAIKTTQGVEFEVEGQLEINETTTPRSLDWKNFSGPDQQPLPNIVAIYRLEGDRFTVRNGGLLGRRPKELTRGEGVLNDLVEFQRLPPTDDEPTANSAPLPSLDIAAGGDSPQSSPR